MGTRAVRCIPQARDIIRAVAEKHGVSVLDILGSRRTADISAIRFEAYTRVRDLTALSLPQIARVFGDRHHTTIMHGIREHRKENGDMNITTIAGNIGKDAELRTTQNGKKVAGFSVAVSGRNDETTWFDCSLWGDRAEKLARYIRKGDRITVAGEVSAREHNGKAYLQLFVKDLTFQSPKRDDSSEGYSNASMGGEAPAGGLGALDDDIPW